MSPRSVLVHAGFPGKEFLKAKRAAPQKIQKQIDKNLADLYSDLTQFSGSIYLDNRMRIWKAKRYYVQAKCDLDLVELTCSGAMRVIAAHCAKRNRVWLLAATLHHDHDRLKQQTDTAVSQLSSGAS